ncbi:MAG: response regulator [Acidobacteria bacterium]|nr:response regulator [Acidobacteriota bacterium]
MFETLKFMIIEDMERDREEVLNIVDCIQDLPENLLAAPSTFQKALEALEDYANDLDVVFLDLNLPRDASDSRPERDHGRKILDTIHNSYNPRLGIRVVVVSGEDLIDGWNDLNMYQVWPGTLVSIAQKSALSKTLTASLKRLRKDPLAQRIRRAKLEDILQYYERVVDGAQRIGERLKSARALALCLVRNEVDHYLGAIGATTKYADDLNRLIKDHVESRFAPAPNGRRYIDIGKIESTGGWGAFLWRGVTVQHLYSLNQYRNSYEHLREQPYENDANDTWEIPRDSMDRARAGQETALVAEHIVRDLLDWYLPWHEQVYIPWAKEQK